MAGGIQYGQAARLIGWHEHGEIPALLGRSKFESTTRKPKRAYGINRILATQQQKLAGPDSIYSMEKLLHHDAGAGCVICYLVRHTAKKQSL